MGGDRKNLRGTVVKKFSVSPGRMDILTVVRDLLGKEAIVDAGEWCTPIYIECTQQDSEALYQLLHEFMSKINDPEIIRLSIVETRLN